MRMLRKRIGLGALYGAITAVFCSPLFVVPDGLGYQDWDVQLFLHGSVFKSLAEYGQLPFWNPWYCGGNVLWQNPQVALLTPVYPLATVVSLPLAMKINVALHYWVGFLGMHLLLTRTIGLRFLPAVVFLGSLFTLSGAFAMHLAVGHGNFLPAFYLPLQLFLYLRALTRGAVRDAASAGGVLALMVFNGGLHVVPMAAAGIGVCGVLVAMLWRDWRPMALAAVAFAAGLALSAPKLVPTALYVAGPHFWDTRVPTAHPDLTTIEMLVRAYIDPYQTRGLKLDGQVHGWHEYGNYIGLPAALLLVTGVAWALSDRRHVNRSLGAPLAGTTLLLLAMSVGEFSAFAPAAIAGGLPLLSNFRIPSRYTIVVVLFGTLTLASTIRATRASVTLTKELKVLIGMLCLLATGDLLVRNRAQLRGVFDQPPVTTVVRWFDGPTAIETDVESDPYRPGSPMFSALMRDRAFYRCYEVMQLDHTADPDHPLVFGDERSKIFTATFSPNRVELSVVGGGGASTIRLNQNFADGWQSDAGPVLRDPESGKPSVVLAAGQVGRYAFRFVPPGLTLGVVVCLIGATLIGVARNSTVRRPLTRSEDQDSR